MKKTNVVLIYFVVSVFLAALPAFGTPSPTEQLKPTLDKLVTILGDQELQGDEKKRERRQKIMSTIAERFDFQEMSKRVLGSPWRDINEEQKKYFTELMTKLLENNYIGQLENYSGQKIEYVGERIKDDKAQVSTLIENNGAIYPVHYIMSQEGERWLVYDINIEGVSLVRNYRAEFKSIIRKDKYEGLVKILEEKNKSFE